MSASQWTAQHEEYFTKVIKPIEDGLSKIMVGQRPVIRRVVQGLFAVGQRDFDSSGGRFLGAGHILCEGPTGTGKTVLCKAMSCLLAGENNRVQGVPDGTVSDVLGCEVILLTGDTKTIKGPIFCNVLLADEINRLPHKVQSAFNQVLAEGEITIGGKTYNLTKPFFCLATQNPTEQKGTSELQEALSDRFMFGLITKETSDEDKLVIETRTRKFNPELFKQVVNCDQINEVREFFFDRDGKNFYVSNEAKLACVKIMNLANHPERYGLFTKELSLLTEQLFKQNPSVNDRTMLHLVGAAMMEAVWHKRAYVLPKDVYNIAADVLRIRLMIEESATFSLLGTDDQNYRTKTELREYILKSIVSRALVL